MTPPSLSILIPTYNRCDFLERNCRALLKFVMNAELEGNVKIIVSNNASLDGTAELLDSLTLAYSSVIDVVHQETNIGSVSNVLFLLGYATSDYVLFLGDDDFLNEEYLLKVFSVISSRHVGAIVPSNKGVLENGEEIGFSRDIGLPSSTYPAGFMGCLKHSWRGHQMSGLVFRLEGLSDDCEKYHIDNMYLFVFLVARSALRHGVEHITEYPVLVTRPSQEAKGWSYGDDGLLSDFLENYNRLPGVSYCQRVALEIKALDEQYWRYAMYIKVSLWAFFKVLLKVILGKNTSLFTSIFFLFLLPLIILKRIVSLSISGGLMKTLGRRVDL